MPDDAAPDGEVEQAEPQPTPLGLLEIGSAGLNITGGMVQEEFLPELRGERGRRVYQQMSDNDPVVGAFLFGLNQLIGGLPWAWEAPDEADELEQAAADFVAECWEDMEDPWDAILEDVMSFATFGWALLETVYKIRQGPDAEDPAYRSRFDDDRIGWRRFAPRGQSTLLRWERDENGRVLGMVQSDPYAPHSREVYIPLAKAALFRISQAKSNPEGRSLLRTAYRPWLFKTRLEEFEAIGIERDLVGYPVVTTPADWHLPEASAANRAALLGARNLVKNMRRGQSEGAVLPAMFDDRGNKLFSVELITSGGTRQIDVGAVIQRKSTEIAMSVLADFLMLGHESTGTYSLGVAKVDLWTLSVQAVAKSIAEVMNRTVVPKLLYLNGFAPTRTPKLAFGDISRVDLAALGPFLKVLLDAQVITADTDLEAWARKLIGAPGAPADPLSEDALDPVAQVVAAGGRPSTAAVSDVPDRPTAPVPPAPTVETPTPVPVASPGPAPTAPKVQS
jgi:hypothetical protein